MSTATALAYLLNKYANIDRTIKTIQFIPRGIPLPSNVFDYSIFCNREYLLSDDGCSVWSILPVMLFPAFKIALMSSMICFSVINLFAEQLEYLDKVSLNHDLFALGIANIAGPFLGHAFVCSGSLPRTSISVKAGSKSLLVSVLSALALIIVLFSLNDLLSFIPLASLAGIILSTCVPLILKITELFKLFSSWKSNAFDILLWILVYISTICYDMDLGLLVGIVLCIVRLIFQQVKKRIEN